MTSLNPSHNPFRKSSGRHAQAIHRSSDTDADADADFPEDLPISDTDEIGPVRKGRKEGRKRIRKAVPPMPDLRFEQSYLLSIRPYLSPRPSPLTRQEKGPVPDEKGNESKSLVTGAEDDEVFHWGREVDVNWGMVTYITFRDQFLSPLIQGALWGWAGLLLASTATGLRSSLYPVSPVSKGRITGGAGGGTDVAGGGEAVGGAWWSKWVKSWAGGIESATV